MESKKQLKSIRLTECQSAWLKIIAPETPHADYVKLRKAENSSAKDILFDNGNFGRFLRGELACSMELAEAVFKVYHTSAKQMEAVKDFSFLPAITKGSRSSTRVADMFFKKCGEILWQGAKHKGRDSGEKKKPAGLNAEPILLDLVSCVLEHRSKLTYSQKFTIFGELLDYLNETRQYKRWPQWMIALSRQPNRDMFKKIRTKSAGNVFFPGVKKDADGRLLYDMEVLKHLTKEELDDCAFFVRRVNMRINEIRSDNFKKQQDEFDAISEKLLFDEGNLLFSALRELKERGKSFARNYFAWAKENVKPYLEAVRKTNNPHRWYFLMCATRLMYDWARWHYYSTEDIDKQNSCDMYRDIRALTEECSGDGDASPVIKCRFYYMAATACRYMAECSSEGIWQGDESAADYASTAVDYAQKAVREFDNYSAKMPDCGEKNALNYRFNRNCARILTFAARWWLLHPNDRGVQPHMTDEDSDFPEEYGIELMNKVRRCYENSVFLPIGANDYLGDGPVVLYGKRQLEYEFYLRVCFEILAYQCKIGMSTEKECGNEGKGGNNEVDLIAMSIFCRMLAIYDYLFKAGNTSESTWPRRTELTIPTVHAARKWLDENDSYRGDDRIFDISQLDKTLQGVPPSLEETSFEILCSFMFSTACQKRAVDSALWRHLKKIESKADKWMPLPAQTLKFVEEVWRPARKALKSDFDKIIGIMKAKTAKFNEENKDFDKRKNNWKEYPPFRPYRYNLLAAPGSNSKHVDCLMRHFGFEWDRVIKEMEG